jgi:hypothetical protein
MATDACPAPPPPSITIVSGSATSQASCSIRCHFIALNLRNITGGSYRLRVYYDGATSPRSTYHNLGVPGGDTNGWQFGSYAGDHGVGSYYTIRVVIDSGPGGPYDSGFQTFVNQ